MYIENINSPKDLKSLTIEQLGVVAEEVRQGVLNRVSHHGGHVGPNLGFTEATCGQSRGSFPQGQRHRSSRGGTHPHRERPWLRACRG